MGTDEIIKVVDTNVGIRMWQPTLESFPLEVNFDRNGSPIGTSELTSTEQLKISQGPAIATTDNATIKQIRAQDILQGGVNSPIFSKQILYELRFLLTEEECQFFPIEIRCRDGWVKDRFFVVRPLIRETCIDLEASDVDIISSIGMFVSWSKLVEAQGCLARCSIARDKNSQIVLISEKFFHMVEKFEAASKVFVPLSHARSR